MTTFMLKTGHQAQLAAQPIVVRVQSGDGAEPHRLEVLGEQRQPVSVDRHGMLVLPVVDQRITVRVLPSGEGRFPSQSLITLMVGPDSRDPDVDRAMLDQVDVSGLAFRDLITVEPVGERLQVTALGTVADTPLPPRAEMARDAARELLGVPQAATADAMDISVAVDVSVSMRQPITDGTVEATLEFLAGLGSVVAAGRSLDVSLCGQTLQRLATEPPEKFTAAAMASVAEAPLTTGFRSALAGPGGPRSLVFLITDGIPADLDVVDPSVDSVRPPHLVLLVPSGFAETVRVPEGVPYTVIGVEPVGSGRTTSLGSDRRQCTEIVRSLLVGYDAQARTGGAA